MEEKRSHPRLQYQAFSMQYAQGPEQRHRGHSFTFIIPHFAYQSGRDRVVAANVLTPWQLAQFNGQKAEINNG